VAKSIGANEARTHLPKLLQRVARGDQIAITHSGKPIARLVPYEDERHRRTDAVQSIRQLRKGNRLGGLSVRQLIEEGRT
jgi:prevent-host-death family protein